MNTTAAYIPLQTSPPALVTRRTRLCSGSGAFLLSLAAVAILAPLFLALDSDGFYARERRVLVSPNVALNGDFSLYISGTIANNQQWTGQYHSTDRSAMDMLAESASSSASTAVLFPQLQTLNSDLNRDELYESLVAIAHVPLPATVAVSSIRLVLGANISLPEARIANHVTQLVFEHKQSPIPLLGQVAWSATLGVQSSTMFTSTAISSPTLPRLAITLDSLSHTWRSPRATSAPLTLSVNLASGGSGLRIPISIRPSVGHVIKWAWVQYVAIALVSYVVWRATLRVLVAFGVVESEIKVMASGRSFVGGGAGSGMVGNEFKPACF